MIYWNGLETEFFLLIKTIAERWGYITALSSPLLPAIDGLLAATALMHNLAIVTRNGRDFTVPGLEVINPWE